MQDGLSEVRGAKRKFSGSLKKALLIIPALMLAGSALAGPPAAPAGYKWEQVWALTDEFNDTVVNANKWLKYNPYWIGRAPGLFDEEQVTESGGFLRLKNTKFADTSETYWVKTGFLASKSATAVTAGMYVEARMKFARDGTVGGFWFSQPGGVQEIDVQEGVGYPANGNWALTKLMRMNTHYDTLITPYDYSTTAVGDVSHTYAVWWHDKNGCTMYLDGTPVKYLSFQGEFTGAMQLNLNTETQNWIGDPTVWRLNNNNYNTTLVNYVRTWRLVKQ